MKRVTGIGGIFFKAKDPKALGEWYKTHLGVKLEDWGGSVFNWKEGTEDGKDGMTVWGLFKAETEYFKPSEQSFMINYRVENLVALIDVLKSEGVEVADGPKDDDFGKFAWIMDPEGNKIELWEPNS